MTLHDLGILGLIPTEREKMWYIVIEPKILRHFRNAEKIVFN